MRNLPSRSKLPEKTFQKLVKETQVIAKAEHPKEKAKSIYENARKTKWFEPVIKALKEMSGPGERCMFCSGSEASQVEHFRPKAIFPLVAMTWENFLWSCGICNQNKGERFPPNTEHGESLINPVEEDVWSFFFIDEFGNLSARWRNELNDVDPRATKTIEILGLDRDALQQTRQRRLKDLRDRIDDSVKLFRQNQLDVSELRSRYKEWCSQPFQPDVANYFLEGPGRNLSPFCEFCSLLGNINTSAKAIQDNV